MLRNCYRDYESKFLVFYELINTEMCRRGLVIMIQNIITCIAVVAAIVSIALAVLYVILRVQCHKINRGKVLEMKTRDPDVAYSGLPTADFDAVEYIQDNSEVYGMTNMGVTMDNREIYVCDLKIGNP